MLRHPADRARFLYSIVVSNSDSINPAAPKVPIPSVSSAVRRALGLEQWRFVLAIMIFAGAGVLLVYLGRSLWFFGDEWDFLLHRDAFSFSDLMRPHNEHWSTIPILSYRAMFSVFSLETYIPYLAILSVLQVAIASLVYALLVREGAPWGFGIVAGVGVILFGPGAENLVWAFQIGFVGSLAAFLGTIIFLEWGPNRRFDLVAAGLLVAAVMSSGLGVGAVAAVLLALFVRREWSRALRVTAVPIVIGVIWVLAYRDSILGPSEGGRIDAILLLPQYVVAGFTAALQGLLGYVGSFGPLLFVVVAAVLVVWALRGAPVSSVPVVAPVSMALFVLTLAGLGRSARFGIEQATASRYVYIVGVLVLVGLGAAFFSSEAFKRLNGRWLTAILMTAATLIVVSNLGALRSFAWERTALTGPTKAAVVPMVVAVQRSRSGDILDAVQPVSMNPDIDVRSVKVALASGKLRLSPSDTASVTDAQIDVSRARMQVRWTDQQPVADIMRAEIRSPSAVVVDPVAAGCWDVTASIGEAWFILEPVQGGSVKVVPSVAGTVAATSAIDGLFVVEALTQRAVDLGSVLWLNVAPNASAVRIDIPEGGSTSVCFSP